MQLLLKGHHPPFPHFTQQLQFPESHYNDNISSPFSDVPMLSRRYYLVSGCECHEVEQEAAVACELPKENRGVQRTQNITVTDPLDVGLCQPNNPESPWCRLFVTSSQRPHAACPAHPGPQDRAGSRSCARLLRPDKEPPGTWTRKNNFFIEGRIPKY